MGSAGPHLTDRLRSVTATAMGHVDLLVVLPLESPDVIRVPDDEDPLEGGDGLATCSTCAGTTLVGSVPRVLEVAGSPESRLAQVLAVVAAAR